MTSILEALVSLCALMSICSSELHGPDYNISIAITEHPLSLSAPIRVVSDTSVATYVTHSSSSSSGVFSALASSSTGVQPPVSITSVITGGIVTTPSGASATPSTTADYLLYPLQTNFSDVTSNKSDVLTPSNSSCGSFITGPLPNGNTGSMYSMTCPISLAASYPLPTAFTVASWVQFLSSAVGTNPAFFSNGAGMWYDTYSFGGVGSTFRTYWMVVDGTTSYTFQSGISPPLTSTSWNHLAITYDGTTAIIYSNGVSVANTTDPQSVWLTLTGGNHVSFFVSALVNVFNLIYTPSILAPSDISTIYQQGITA